jgi:hypothetical protein
MLDDVKAAYEEARRVSPKEYKPLPEWSALPIEIREAFIHVYGKGIRDARKEEKL